MSEEKPKTVEDCQKEYNLIAPQAGDLSFRIKVLEHQLAAIHQRMSDINELAAKIAKEAKEEGDKNESKSSTNG